MSSVEIPRAATLADVARRAGVSMATASKALNGRPEVGAATRARVLDAAAGLDFTPNAMARSLMSGRTQTVGLLTNDLEGRFVLPLMIGAEDALGEAETMALMVNSRGRTDLEDGHLMGLLGRRVDGLILVGHGPEPRSRLTRRVTVPAVYAYAPSPSLDDISVLADHRADGRLATEHLLSDGRRRLAHIAGPLDGRIGGYTAARLRLKGFQDAIAERGLDAVGGEPASGDWTEQWGWEQASRLVDQSPIDGLVCGNDQIARGAIDLLMHRGLDVPRDVAVIGFDNALSLVAYSRLPQTSVEMGLYEVGRLAARAVLQPGSLGPGHHKVPGHLVQRQTTRP